MESLERIVVVTRRTRLQELVERFNTRAQARFWIERSGGDYADYEREDDAYRRSLEALRDGLPKGVKSQSFDRGFLPTFLFTARDLVLAIGQDGLVANAAKYVKGQPVIGVNPDPARYDGILVPFTVARARDAVARALDGSAACRDVTLAEAVLQDGQSLLAFNDFYVGMQTHVSSRYVLAIGGRSEAQSSSGFLVSTGAGSTGWISSVFAMAAGVTAFAGGTPGRPRRLPWEDPRLLFAVREPFVSRHSAASIVAGEIGDGEELVAESRMPAGGVVFSDGMEHDALVFTSGSTVRIRRAARCARLVAA